jgi:hypothetical protein
MYIKIPTFADYFKPKQGNSDEKLQIDQQHHGLDHFPHCHDGIPAHH